MSTWDSARALLEGIPALDGARCKNRSELYERTNGEHRMTGRLTTTELESARCAALRICSECPALRQCRAYLQGLPMSQRPRGVIAGLVITSTGLPAKTRTPTHPVVEDQDDAQRAAQPRPGRTESHRWHSDAREASPNAHRATERVDAQNAAALICHRADSGDFTAEWTLWADVEEAREAQAPPNAVRPAVYRHSQRRARRPHGEAQPRPAVVEHQDAGQPPCRP
ncbi:hypothetical protein [Mycolicibacterium sp. XJ879]